MDEGMCWILDARCKIDLVLLMSEGDLLRKHAPAAMSCHRKDNRCIVYLAVRKATASLEPLLE
jgi:hypothetical protein